MIFHFAGRNSPLSAATLPKLLEYVGEPETEFQFGQTFFFAYRILLTPMDLLTGFMCYADMGSVQQERCVFVSFYQFLMLQSGFYDVVLFRSWDHVCCFSFDSTLFALL